MKIPDRIYSDPARQYLLSLCRAVATADVGTIPDHPDTRTIHHEDWEEIRTRAGNAIEYLTKEDDQE